ncbi:uncharacterized protein TNIN_461191, partial [Trichonephila inaurata madagascariensis]
MRHTNAVPGEPPRKKKFSPAHSRSPGWCEEREQLERDDALPLAQIKELPSGPLVAEFDWLIPEIIIQTSRPPRGHTHHGPVFLTSRPGYKLRLAFTVGHTHSLDGLNYFGLVSLVPGPYDETLRWPFPYAVNLTLVSRGDASLSQHVTLRQSLAQCRMRPGSEEIPNVGCGKAFLVPQELVFIEGRAAGASHRFSGGKEFHSQKDSSIHEGQPVSIGVSLV